MEWRRRLQTGTPHALRRRRVGEGLGFAAGATKASAAAPARAPRPPLDPSAYESQAAFKRAVALASWADRHQAFSRYLNLRARSPGLAERFLSGVFRSRNAFQIALVDPADGSSPDVEEMLAALRSDLVDRVHNDFAVDQLEQRAQALAVSAIRAEGASSGQPAPRLYSASEVDAVLDNFKTTSSALRGCYAAVSSVVPEGSRVTRALANLSRLCASTSTLWSARQGRKFSVGVFTAQLKWLAEDVYRVLPGSGAARVDPHLRQLCMGPQVSDARESGMPAPPAVGGDLEALAVEVASAAAAEQAPFPRAEKAIALGASQVTSEVPLRVDSALLYPPPFLFLAQRARYSLDSLQASWARRLLGCAIGPALPGEAVLAHCGWHLRLGTKMVERAILARAKLFLLPETHPGASMLRLASATSCPTWASAAQAVMEALDSPIPDVVDWPRAGEQVLGAPLCVATLPRCGGCGALDVDIWHALFACLATATHRAITVSSQF
ncbi:unnamed protein product [Prorocentrum cordatum]|uniref:Uncharacterized protein n=1 Tax=Prorocentrum cordatum TaxID=2364126 RepID=A0ABN9XX99_9DINO|nr:unnamed protein product [Polarella glacialis]